MLKKILLTLIAVLIAGGALMVYGTYKAADDFVKNNEPQLRQYTKLDEAAQNEFVKQHEDELLAQISMATTNPEDKTELALLEKMSEEPDVKKARVELGRAIIAAAILHSDSIVAELNDTLKAKYKDEAESLKTCMTKYYDALDAAEKKFKGAQ